MRAPAQCSGHEPPLRGLPSVAACGGRAAASAAAENRSYSCAVTYCGFRQTAGSTRPFHYAGIIYGLQPWGLAQQLGVSVGAAQVTQNMGCGWTRGDLSLVPLATTRGCT